MGSHITAEERALIEAAIAKGKITKCKRGESSDPGSYWCPKECRLKSKDPHGNSWRDKRKRNRRYKSPEVVKRQNEVAELLKQGLTRVEIARLYGVTEQTIVKDAVALRMTQFGHKPHYDPQAEANREAVLAAFAPELSCGEISERTKLSACTVRRHLNALGLTPARRRSTPSKKDKRAKNRTERQAEVRRLFAEGVGAPQIAKQLGWPKTTVYDDLYTLGLRTPQYSRKKAK